VQIGNNRLETDLDALIRKAQAEAPTIETIARGTFGGLGVRCRSGRRSDCGPRRSSIPANSMPR
jgi:hypothetical protein